MYISKGTTNLAVARDLYTYKTTLRVIRRLWGRGVQHVAASDHTSMSLNSLCNHIETVSVSHRHRSNTTFHIDITYVSHQYHIGITTVTTISHRYNNCITPASHRYHMLSHRHHTGISSSIYHRYQKRITPESHRYHIGITSISHRYNIGITSV